MHLRRGFHVSAILRRRWSEDCDARLLAAYDRIGPAWPVISAEQPGRSVGECRRRWLHLAGVLDREPYAGDKELWLQGYERITLQDGQRGWIRVPGAERLPEDPFERIATGLPLFRANWNKKLAGWSELERLALREGYEQYVHPASRKGGHAENEHRHDTPETETSSPAVDAAWLRIARRFSRRTATQCRNFFNRQHVLWRSDEKLTQISQDLDGPVKDGTDTKTVA